MNVLHESAVSKCEYSVDGELTLICYKGKINEKFIFDCIIAKTENEGIQNSKFLLLDLRHAEFDFARVGIVNIAKQIRTRIGMKTAVALIVDQPRETAVAYLLKQNLSQKDVNIFASPLSAFSTFEPRTTKDLYASEIFSLVCE